MRNLMLKVYLNFKSSYRRRFIIFHHLIFFPRSSREVDFFTQQLDLSGVFLCFMHNLWISPSSSIQLKRSFTSSWNLEITFIKGGLKSWGTKNTNLPILYFFLYVLYLLSSTHCVGIVVFTRRLQAKTSRRKNSLYLFLNLSIWNKIQDK